MPGSEATPATTGGTPGDGGTPPQAAAQQAQQQNGTGGTPGTGEMPGQAEDTTALRETLRKEREARSAAEKRLKAIEEKDLPEAERQKLRLVELERHSADLEQQLKRERVSNAVTAQAAKLGFADPADAVRFIDLSAIEITDRGEPRGISEQLRQLLASKPYLASSTARASGSAEGGVRGGGRPENDMNARLRAAAGRGPS